MRIVSLCPSITETLIDFGLRDRLVGVTRFCIHPAEAVKDLPKVGGTKNPDLDAIERAAPDLVFVNAEENRREDYDRLSMKYRVDVSMPRSVADVPLELRRFGELLSTRPIAGRRARELEVALRELERRREGKRRFSFAYPVWRRPWMVAGPDTYVADSDPKSGRRQRVHARPGALSRDHD